jgi:hypothetical protein
MYRRSVRRVDLVVVPVPDRSDQTTR